MKLFCTNWHGNGNSFLSLYFLSDNGGSRSAVVCVVSPINTVCVCVCVCVCVTLQCRFEKAAAAVDRQRRSVPHQQLDCILMFWYDASLALLFLPPNQPPSLFSNSSPSSHIPLPPSLPPCLPPVYFHMSLSFCLHTLPPTLLSTLCGSDMALSCCCWYNPPTTSAETNTDSNHMGPEKKKKKKKKLLYRCGTEQQRELYRQILTILY